MILVKYSYILRLKIHRLVQLFGEVLNSSEYTNDPFKYMKIGARVLILIMNNTIIVIIKQNV